MVNDMIERVAEALAEDAGWELAQFHHSKLGREHLELWRKQARAAIEAMREPSERMDFEGACAFERLLKRWDLNSLTYSDAAKIINECMINAALAEDE